MLFCGLCEILAGLALQKRVLSKYGIAGNAKNRQERKEVLPFLNHQQPDRTFTGQFRTTVDKN